TLLISVPIEIGAWGTLKFLAKRSLGYGLQELPGPPSSLQYLRKLLVGRPISVLRDARKNWSTHFGFDYRDVEAKLEECGLGIARAETRAGNRIILAGRREDGSAA